MFHYIDFLMNVNLIVSHLESLFRGLVGLKNVE